MISILTWEKLVKMTLYLNYFSPGNYHFKNRFTSKIDYFKYTTGATFLSLKKIIIFKTKLKIENMSIT